MIVTQPVSNPQPPDRYTDVLITTPRGLRDVLTAVFGTLLTVGWSWSGKSGQSLGERCHENAVTQAVSFPLFV